MKQRCFNFAFILSTFLAVAAFAENTAVIPAHRTFPTNWMSSHEAFVKQAKPGANVGLIGIGAPVPALKYLNSRETYWAKKAGLKIVGSQDNPTDDVTGGEKAANGLLQRYANINAIIGYNDPSALGAYTAARGAGKQLTIVGLNGTSDGIAGLKSGRIAATVQTDAVGFGRQQAYAAYSLITKQNLPLPKIIVRPAILVTKANLSSMPSYAAQVASIK